jgi:hypothetical protein
LIMSVPQLEMHPFFPGAEVPGGPRDDFMQKSDVVPHWPQTLQQALSGHGLRSAMLTPEAGFVVPGFCGPQTAFWIGAGIGGAPELRHMLMPAYSKVQPDHPHVPWFRLSSSFTVSPFAAAILSHQSPALTRYDAQLPSELGFGLTSGKLPLLQHAR